MLRISYIVFYSVVIKNGSMPKISNKWKPLIKELRIFTKSFILSNIPNRKINKLLLNIPSVDKKLKIKKLALNDKFVQFNDQTAKFIVSFRERGLNKSHHNNVISYYSRGNYHYCPIEKKKDNYCQYHNKVSQNNWDLGKVYFERVRDLEDLIDYSLKEGLHPNWFLRNIKFSTELDLKYLEEINKRVKNFRSKISRK